MIILRKIFFTSLKIVVGIIVIDALLVGGFALSEPVVDTSDAIIVLGAAINTPALRNRAVHGLELWEDAKAPVIIASGGRRSDDDPAEAEQIKSIIEFRAEKEVPVIVENQSNNTYENIRNSREKIPDAKSVIIVSDKFHLARAVLLAKAAGFDDVSWSAPDSSYYRASELRYYYFREMVALISYVPKILKLAIAP